jgi:hypothetical protein
MARVSCAEIERPRAIVPASQSSSIFERHRRALLPTALFFHTAAVSIPFLSTIPFLAAGSALAAAIGSTIGLGVTLALLSRGALIGNARLERRIRARLSAETRKLEFVGICALENNTLERRIHRFETDDNVGLLALTDDRLVVLSEDGRIDIPRDAISSVRLEPLPDYPRLSWIRIDFDDADDRTGFLIMSRDASNLPDLRRKTHVLYDRLVSWFADAQLSWLERNRGIDQGSMTKTGTSTDLVRSS